MSRFLFVVPPIPSHVIQVVPIADELVRAGHEVAWVGPRLGVTAELPRSARLYGLGDAENVIERRNHEVRPNLAKGIASLRFFFDEILAPLTRLMLPGVEDAVEDFSPDIVVVDRYAFAGALVARRAGLTWATSATTPFLLPGDTDATSAKVKDWIDERLRSFERELGLRETEHPGLSPRLVLCYTSRAFLGEDRKLPENVHLLGCALGSRAADPPFDYDRLGARPRVLVTLGTILGRQGGRFFETVVEALAGEVGQLILGTAPERAPAGPANMIAQERLPQLRLLEEVDAVISHGGPNTVNEALLNGLPLVAAPVMHDQGWTTQRVVELGVGRRVRFQRLSAAEVKEASLDVLTQPSYSRAARRIGDSLRDTGGARVATNELLLLAG